MTGRLLTSPARWLSIAVLTTFTVLPFCGGALAQPATPVPADATAWQACKPRPSGYILFAPVDQQGNSAPGVVVADPGTGRALTTIDVPAADRIVPLLAPGKALMSTADGKAFLIDAAAESATELPVPERTGALFEWSQGIPLGAGQHKTLLTDGMDVFLLDIDSGSLADLRSLLPADTPKIPLFPTISSDERSILLWDGLQLWLAPTDRPAEIRSVSPGADSFGGSFSSDGASVIYSRKSTSGDGRELVIEPVYGSAQPEIVASGKLVIGIFVGGDDTVAVDRITETTDGPAAELLLVDRATGDQRPLLSHEVEPVTLTPSPNGKHLMVGINASDSGRTYTDIDLSTGATLKLPLLNGLILYGPTGGAWRVAAPVTGISDSAPAPGYYAVNLNDGSATMFTPITLGEGVMVSQPTFSRDGSVAMSAVFGAKDQTLWVLDLANEKATDVRQGAFAGASLSPDGCWFAVGDVTDNGTARLIAISVQRAGSSAKVSLGPGLMPVWVDG